MNDVSILERSTLHELRYEWNRIAQHSAAPSIFLRHEWFDAASQWLPEKSRLRVLCVVRDGLVIGICPFVQMRTRYRGMNLRTLKLLCIPDTQLCDVLAEPQDHELVVAALAGHLARASREWDYLEIVRVAKDSKTLPALSAALAAARLRSITREYGTNPYIDLTVGWSGFYAQRSRRLKKGNNLIANKLKKNFKKIELQWLRGDHSDPAEVSDCLAQITEISANSWKRSTGLTLEREGPGAFIRAMTHHARENGWLSIWLLLLDGRPAAMEYQLIYGGTVHALRADFDTELGELSPGSYLNWKLLERLFESGLRRYEMGVGDNPYKQRWTDTSSELFQINAYSNSPKGRMLAWLQLKVRPLVERYDTLKSRHTAGNAD